MNARVLDRSEWEKIPKDSGLPQMLPLLDDVSVVVVEDGGRIAACWAVFRATHVEGVYIVPEYRKRFGVVAKLLRKTAEVANRWGGLVWTGAATDCVRDLIDRLGGKEIPMATYVLNFRGR